MDDLISRQAAIDALCNVGCGSGYCGVSCDDVKAIEQLPSAEVVPVKHGRWEWIGGYGYQYRCSECIMCAERRTKYCPNCGAKMNEEGEGHEQN